MLRSEILKLLSFSLLIALQAQSAPVFDNPHAYYGQDFYNELAQGKLNNQDLKDKLNAILKKIHIGHPDDYDEISESCPSKSKCTQFRKFSYNEARQFLFGSSILKSVPKVAISCAQSIAKKLLILLAMVEKMAQALAVFPIPLWSIPNTPGLKANSIEGKPLIPRKQISIFFIQSSLT
jgi:hypothetical protein